ncbi:MAG: hypothetical protein ACD_29C00071G0004 [uncultured bacterium]|nr:MAG: hypothetical protein ACD_29C00071G0004 [uncultured bacterium]
MRAIKKSSHQSIVFYCAVNQNPAMNLLAKYCFVENVNMHEKIGSHALNNKIDFAIIGPEAPLANGLVDYLNNMNIHCIGPKKKLAQIESSKGFARDVMLEYKISGLPEYKRFSQFNQSDIIACIKTLNNNYVIKNDGLCGGKGVKVSGEHLHSQEDALNYCREINSEFVIEEKLMGPEFSLISFTDGETLLHFPPVQDHKRAYENDTGPNTGGMGSYTMENHLLPFLNQQNVRAAEIINEKMMAALQNKCEERYIGFIYGGFMLTKSGVKVIEFNARLGDPEALNLLAILQSDFIELCLLGIEKKLLDFTLSFENKATVVKYLVPMGYPEKSIESEIKINNTENNDHYFFGSVKNIGEKLMTMGSRAIAVLGKGETLDQAEQQAEHFASKIKGNIFYRKDIGTHQLIQRYMSMINDF